VDSLLQAQTYHAKEFTSAEQNYWNQGDAILGEWQGKLAASYGLTAGVDAKHFAHLSEGQNPLTVTCPRKSLPIEAGVLS
jgi:TrwC relaxase